jgi:hypothetical protein
VEHVARHLRHRLAAALSTYRVVVLHGARQCGKTTLARAVAAERGGAYVSLDDEQALDAALADPHTFVRTGPYPLVVDEVQIAGERLVRAVKMAVDADDVPGRFLLTGSTNFLTVPTISESLAGRAAILRLWPLSRAELAGAPATTGATALPGVIGRWFDGETVAAAGAGTARDDYLEMVCAGGYPEALRLEPAGRAGWFDGYVETVLARDVVALGDIRRAALLARLLRLAAASTAGEVNITDWAQRLAADRATVDSYLQWLRTVFLVHDLAPWTRNRAARVVRRPKLHLTDSGLAAAMLGLDAAALRPPTATATGPLVETFVVNEIARRLGAAIPRVTLHHYRDNARHEVDLVLERADGAVVAVEIKATASPRAGDLRHVAALRDRLDAAEPGAFRAGILLHTGTGAYTVGDRLHTAPVDTLWHPPA